MIIGKYSKNNSLSDFWGKIEHIEKIRNINTKWVCESDTSCNCRYADYQKSLEQILLESKFLQSKNNKNSFSSRSKRISKFL